MRFTCAVITSVCVCASGSALAAEWSAQPTFSSSVDHDTNRGLGPEERGSQGAFLQADLLLRRATSTSSMWLRPHAGWQEYTNSVAQNQKSLSLAGASAWSMDRNQFSAQASISRDNTLNNEANDTGALTGTSERNAKSASLAWSHVQSERRQLDVQLGYSDIRYENQQFLDFFGLQIPFVNLYGYKYPSLNLSETMRWSDRTSFQITSYANRLISRSDLGDSDSYGIRFGLTRALTEHYSLNASLGSSLQVNDAGNEDGYIGRLGLDYIGDLSRWSVYGERSVSPSAFGYLVTRNEAGASFDRRPLAAPQHACHGSQLLERGRDRAVR